jgi:hypothetical protein
MASIVLGTVAKTVGTAFAGPLGGAFAGQLGTLVGNAAAGGRTNRREVEGARLEDLAVQTSTYGRVIANVYGTMRIAGNVIWARPIIEKVTTTTTTTSTGKGGGGSAKSTTTERTYSYFATVAVAICEGEIDSISRIWADADLLSLGKYTIRIYRGTESQLPDSGIESYYGVGKTPAYRGIAYVVFEQFPLAEYGNRIPNFTFEVTRTVKNAEILAESAEQMVTSLMLIPGSGEVVYDPVVQAKVVGEEVGGQWVQIGNRVTMNMHNVTGAANVNLALDHMQETFPNLEWVGVVVNWFGSSLDAGDCVVEPCVEFSNTTRLLPDEWAVAGKTRATARVIGYEDGGPRYGGTPSDAGVVRLVEELRARGLKIFFYPMLLIDLEGKPWRGQLTGTPAQAASFFTRSDGYNAFILHYANLVDGLVDAFAIGTEMKALTNVMDGPGVFPAVSELVTLAASVKGILGSSVKVTYAADWSEYHHSDNGWHHLDPLWASPNIDMVGIDAYFPLSDAPQTGYDKEALKQGWVSGEGYDWYYSDPERTIQAPLSPAYAWKDIAWWWNNAHVNPDSSTTAWVPGSKKIWFTEYGFASVDGTTNEPNRFVDPTSGLGGYPRFSKRKVDFRIQRLAIEATEEQWAGSGMVEEKFLWTWDARPFPQWPDYTDIWSDGGNWVTGHWVQGKLGQSALAAIVKELVARGGVPESQVDTSRLSGDVIGFVLKDRKTVRAALEELMAAFPFDLIESGAVLKAVPRGENSTLVIDAAECLPELAGGRRVGVQMTRTQEMELPRELEVLYLDRLNDYNTATQRASRQATEARSKDAMSLSLVLSDQDAKKIAESQLASRWISRVRYRFTLPVRYAALEPGDVVSLSIAGRDHVVRIESVQFGKPGMLKLVAVAEDAEVYDFAVAGAGGGAAGEAFAPTAETRLEILDIPALPGDGASEARVRFAAAGMGRNWPGCGVYRLDTAGDTLWLSLEQPCVIGTTLTTLDVAEAVRIDAANTLDVALLGDAVLGTVTEREMLDGANAALVGDEVIQFMTATPLGAGKYRLGGLLRGRLGTEDTIAEHVAGERFVLLDATLGAFTFQPEQKGKLYDVAGVTFGEAVSGVSAIQFQPVLRALMPYAPVHVTGLRDGSGNLAMAWVRRARMNGGWQDYQDVPLSEVDERYDVEILNGSTVVRQWRTTSPIATYSVAEQTADFGAPQASVSVRISQISALVGRGVAAEVAL